MKAELLIKWECGLLSFIFETIESRGLCKEKERTMGD